MAKLWITEYRGIGRTAGEGAQVPALPELGVSTVTFTTSTASAAAFRPDTGLIRVYADAACHVAFGAAPVATINSTPLAAASEMYLQIQPGGATRIAAVTA